jgi:SAM-dependent methyltransferase
MLENDEFWDFYWEIRLQEMENLGKREAILAASRLVRQISRQSEQPLRILELGCGEGQVVGTLIDAHSQLCASQIVVGVDYNAQSLAHCRRDFPGWRFVNGDFTDQALLAGLGKYDLVLLVNTLHEVYSAEYSTELGEVNVTLAKQRVEEALTGAVSCLAPEGWLVLFDGLEPAGNAQDLLQVRFMDNQAWGDFQVFASQYYPFRISYRKKITPLNIEITRRDFTRYITKSIFLGKSLWQTERRESYQYFTLNEFQAAFARLGMEIVELRTLTVNADKWRNLVEIVSPIEDFPEEHILIQARRG